MSWFENLWHGISPCMTPGVNGCVVWWDAWAATGSFAAVVVALLFGSAPLVYRRRHARAIAEIVRVKVEQQLLHVGASAFAVAEPTRSGMDENVAFINMENCDPEAIRELLPYFDAIPRRLSKTLALTIVDVETVQRLISQRGFREAGTVAKGTHAKGMLQELEVSLRKAREELCRYTGHRSTVSFEAEYKKIGSALRRYARAADADQDFDEEWLRRHIVGGRRSPKAK